MIDPKKQYRTRDGREVRIYAVDGGGTDHIHGAVKNECGSWVAEQWYSGGKYAHCGVHMKDLIEVKPRIKRKVWVNVYNSAVTASYQKGYRDGLEGLPRIACVEIDIDVEEGHGL